MIAGFSRSRAKRSSTFRTNSDWPGEFASARLLRPVGRKAPEAAGVPSAFRLRLPALRFPDGAAALCSRQQGIHHSGGVFASAPAAQEQAPTRPPVFPVEGGVVWAKVPSLDVGDVFGHRVYAAEVLDDALRLHLLALGGAFPGQPSGIVGRRRLPKVGEITRFPCRARMDVSRLNRAWSNQFEAIVWRFHLGCSGRGLKLSVRLPIWLLGTTPVADWLGAG